MNTVVCKAGIANCKCTLQLHLGEGIYICFIRVPAGEFMMGSRGYSHREEPMHRVVITRDYYLATTPVTQVQARILTMGAGIEHNNHFGGDDRLPAEQLSAEDADACCQWLVASQFDDPCLLSDNGMDRYQPGLPSEAQWEYACKYGVGDHLEFHTGDGVEALAQAGWFGHGISFGDDAGNSGNRTHAVARKRPSTLGLYDMHGNVWELCRDKWNENTYLHRSSFVVDPVSTPSGVRAKRVLRGGSWSGQAIVCRATNRNVIQSGKRSRSAGFRVGLFQMRARDSAERYFD